MNITALKGLIGGAAPVCPEPGCGIPFEDWMDADPNEDKVMYVAQDALFCGTCNGLHLTEFYLKELQAGLVEAHTRTERTYGRRIAQADCEHPKVAPLDVPRGVECPTADGPVEGPGKVGFCLLCGVRRKIIKVIDNTPKAPAAEPKPKGRIIW